MQAWIGKGLSSSCLLHAGHAITHTKKQIVCSVLTTVAAQLRPEMPPGNKTHTISAVPHIGGCKAYARTWDVDHVQFKNGSIRSLPEIVHTELGKHTQAALHIYKPQG